ncbi:MAG: dihydroneopterin aldolase [Acetobacteraceae bacterium]|nr:dihydroneopterin aldolase [Acetobacteraceae bacterium]
MDDRRLPDARRGLRRMFIRDLVLEASVGVLAREHERRQRVRINIDLGIRDEGAAGPALAPGSVGRDNLTRVVDYGALADAVRQIVAAGHVHLIETLAERIAERCLQDDRVLLARVSVEKIDVFPDATSAGVEVERWRR